MLLLLKMLRLGMKTEVLRHGQGHTHMHILTVSMALRMAVTMTERHHLSLVLLELLLLLLLLLVLVLLLLLLMVVVMKHMLRMCESLNQVMLSSDRTNCRLHTRQRSRSSRSSALIP